MSSNGGTTLHGFESAPKASDTVKSPAEPDSNLSWLDLMDQQASTAASDGEPEISDDDAESERRIQGTVNALHADWRRQEESLERAHFDRVVLKRKLDAEEIVEVIRRMKALGVVPENLDDEAGPDEDDEFVPMTGKSLGSDFVAGYTKAPLLTHDEHVRLSRAVQLGIVAQRDKDLGLEGPELEDLIRHGQAARDKMVVANIRLVFTWAHKIGRGAMEFTDHVQNGAIGLMRAVELFDPDVGVRFSTYATWWIRQSVWRGLDLESELVRLPVYQRENIRALRRMARRLTDETGREPRPAELAEALDWPLDKVAFVQRVTLFRATSLEMPLDEEGEMRFGDILPSGEPSPEQITSILSRNKLLRSLVATLSDREQMILDRRFGFTSGYSETLQQIGDDVKVTRERIRQIQGKALKKLYRKALKHTKALTEE